MILIPLPARDGHATGTRRVPGAEVYFGDYSRKHHCLSPWVSRFPARLVSPYNEIVLHGCWLSERWRSIRNPDGKQPGARGAPEANHVLTCRGFPKGAPRRKSVRLEFPVNRKSHPLFENPLFNSRSHISLLRNPAREARRGRNIYSSFGLSLDAADSRDGN
jgi:hypothetical protein